MSEKENCSRQILTPADSKRSLHNKSLDCKLKDKSDSSVASSRLFRRIGNSLDRKAEGKEEGEGGMEEEGEERVLVLMAPCQLPDI